MRAIETSLSNLTTDDFVSPSSLTYPEQKWVPLKYRLHTKKERFKSMVDYNCKKLLLDLSLIKAFHELAGLRYHN